MRRLVIAVATLCISAGLSQLPAAAQSEPENPVLEATPDFLDDPSAATVAEETLEPVQSDPAFDAATRTGEVQIVRGRTARATEPRETTTETRIDPTGLTTPVAITRGAVSPRPPRAEVTEIVEEDPARSFEADLLFVSYRPRPIPVGWRQTLAWPHAPTHFVWYDWTRNYQLNYGWRRR